ncbi:hypothetical protein ANACOL_01747 [Anaerotruncus colihominis DSM 17241]|uniref:Uncharacterized protein n=1 Tax=Anaerotruncus colihominis DSM 17241 TaxID=445972 RepID=B0PAF0_9FIRM|nr:hypothetical protein ANACOL_01747 [Anaerotruncus colihominis DSM 17241]
MSGEPLGINRYNNRSAVIIPPNSCFKRSRGRYREILPRRASFHSVRDLL